MEGILYEFIERAGAQVKVNFSGPFLFYKYKDLIFHNNKNFT